MARFDFKSPGAAFTGQIADVLAERKATERQQLLDQLTMNADVRAQEESGRRKIESEAQLADMKSRRDMQELGLFTQFMRRGDDPTARGVNPEMLELGKRYGMFEQQPTPQVTTSEAMTSVEGQPTGEGAPMAEAPPPVTAPPRWGFVGSGQERQEAEEVAGTAKLIESMMSDPKTRPAGEYLMQVANANRGRVPSELVAKFMEPDQPLNIFDQQTGRLTNGGMVSPRSQTIIHTRPPQERRPRNLMPVLDADGNLKMVDQESVPIGPDGVAQLPPGYSTPRGGGATDQALPLGISNGAFNSYVEELSILEPDEAGKVPAGPMLAVRQRAAQVIGQAKVLPRVKDIAARFVRNPDSIGDETLNEKENLQLRQLLGIIAADPSIANIYRQNAIITKPAATTTTPAMTKPAGTGTPSAEMEKFLLNRSRY